MWPDNEIRELFSVEIPIVQAPMAVASGLEMALAVSEAGGLGSLACATLDAASLRRLLETAWRRTSFPLNVNFFAHSVARPDAVRDQAWLNKLSGYAEEAGVELPKSLSTISPRPFDSEHCEVIEDLKPSVVSFHFGLPEMDLVSRIMSTGATVISSATTVREARWLEDHGCDAIIAQGYEAGGHRGMFLTDDLTTQLGTLSLVPQIVDSVRVPGIAAGGIADGRGVAAAMALGASGVQIGTAYLFTKEAEITEIYRSSLEAAATIDSTITNVVSGRPTRVLLNRLVNELGPMSPDAPEFPRGFAAIATLRSAHEQKGKRDFSAHFVDQSAALVRRSTSFELTHRLASDALKQICQLSCQQPQQCRLAGDP